ncbi:hypothetical protein C8A00DRAFT_35213 [Chaetomidium leptoderma]|uniref:Uncharacterized protein n=1 Tax=Chaetomidium leptoderma TaxID=669021 RepID=A0AAN6VIB1_9PEZI|nr:hypothetical protein C8A00DRAFT_35213 [Chaetomidium leptoderma]
MPSGDPSEVLKVGDINLDDSNQEPAPDTNQNNSDDDDDTTLIEKWAPTIDAISSATRKAFPSSPQGTPGVSPPSRAEFRQYWHGIFTQLLEAVAADPTIPHHLTSPRVTTFVVNLFDKPHGLCCPCSLPDVSPTIALANEQGVDKTDLVRGVRDYLYGETTAPVINTDDDEYDYEGPAAGQQQQPEKAAETTELVMETALVYSADWMSCGNNDEGERVSYYSEEPNVYMYCCGCDEYLAKAGEDDKAK